MNKAENVLRYYVLCNHLKDVIRKGCIIWNVKRQRIESVAEHIYGVQMLAIAMNSEYEYNIDLVKVIMMIAVHELEEIKIGDFGLNEINKEEKNKIGNKAAYEMSDYQKEEFKKNPSKMNALLLAVNSDKDKKEVLTTAIASKEGSGKIFYKSSFNEEDKKYNFEILGCTDSIKNLTSEKQEELLLERFVKMAEFNQNVTGTDHESEFREQLINEYKELRENIVILNTYMEKEKEEEKFKTYKKDITK